MRSDTPRTDAQLIKSPYIGRNVCADFARQLERDLAAAKDTISKYHERIISQHAQIDDLKWSLWKIEGKHKAAILEVITKLAAAQEELASVKAENSKLRSALEIVHFKREPWQ